MLDDFGLPETLRAYLKRFAERTGIHAQLVEALPDRLPSEIEAGVYGIIQEAMNNIARHSAATACIVSLNAVGDEICLIVDDNGRGYHPGRAASNRHRLGLIAMRERAQAQGGTFAIGSLAAGGTRVAVRMTVPVTVQDSAHAAHVG
jgi:signal transduction histidine kinase